MDIPKNFPKPPTYHRQRFLLALLQSTGGCLSKLDLQKLLFLSAQEAGLLITILSLIIMVVILFKRNPI